MDIFLNTELEIDLKLNSMLKIEEAAVIYTDENPFGNITWNNTSEIDRLKEKKYQGFKAGVEFAQRWISVEEELPFGYVTLKCSSPFGRVVYFSVDFSGANEVDTKWMAIEYYKATHWRPIELK